jgi:hypothetical protein
MVRIFIKARKTGDADIIKKLRKVNRRFKELCRSTWEWPWTPGGFGYNTYMHEKIDRLE